MTALMLCSLLIAGVAAEIPDGDGTNGIDRNPTPPEQDRSDLSRVYDPVNAQSSQTLTFDGSKIFSDQAVADGQWADVFSTQNGGWTVQAGTGGAGDSGIYQQTSKTHQTVVIANGVGGAQIEYTQNDDAKDTSGTPVPTGATPSQGFGIEFVNWFTTLDRTATDTGGAGANGAVVQDSGCDASVMSEDVIRCAVSGDNGIGTAGSNPTAVWVHGGDQNGIAAFAVEDTDGSSADLYFGIDFTFLYNITVDVGGVELAQLSTTAGNELADIHIECADVNCTQDPVHISAPTAYNLSSLGATGMASDAEIYNTTSMVAHASGNKVKLTFGIASEDITEATASGVFYDPSVEVMTGEPGIRMGIMEDGGATWCSDRWFMAGCDSTESFDGNASNGVDGVFMEMTMPLETLYSMSSFGGYDSAEVIVSHPTATHCFNGEIRSYVMSSWEDSFSKNSLLTYLTTGDKYDVGTITGFDTSYVVGTSSTDYCTGSASGITTTSIPVSALKDITKDNLLLSYNNGYYDVSERTFSFTIVLEFVAGSSTPASGQSMTIDTSGTTPKVQWKTDGTINPLANSTDITRVGETGSTNPVPASPYVMYYSGVAPSDNVIQGRNLQLIETQGSTFGGTQTDTDMNQRQNIQFAPSASTPRSTVECGLAAAGVEYISAKISVFTNVDTSGNTGENETEWKPYGVLNANNSRWTIGPVSGANTGNGSVDNDELNSGSSTVSYTGVFINGDEYKAVCEFQIKSSDVGADGAPKTTTITYTQLFSAAEDGDYSSGGGSDVDDDDGWFESFNGWDLVIIGLALAIILMGAVMYGNGRAFQGLFDDRLAMILFGVGLLHAWFSHHYYYDVSDPISQETALVVGSLGYLVIALSIYLYGGMTTSRMERNVRYAIGGLLLIILGTPTAINGLFNTSIDAFEDVAWGFPIYDLVAGLGSLVGITIFVGALAGLYRREGGM